MDPDPSVDALCDRVIGCAVAVHTALGPGLLESIYRDCLLIELRNRCLRAQTECAVAVVYAGQRVRDDLRIDLLVEDVVVVEVKSVESLHPVFRAQVITYLKLSGKPAGLILNFNVPLLRDGIRRVDHPEIYAKRPKGIRRFTHESHK